MSSLALLSHFMTGVVCLCCVGSEIPLRLIVHVLHIGFKSVIESQNHRILLPVAGSHGSSGISWQPGPEEKDR